MPTRPLCMFANGNILGDFIFQESISDMVNMLEMYDNYHFDLDFIIENHHSVMFKSNDDYLLKVTTINLGFRALCYKNRKLSQREDERTVNKYSFDSVL